MKKTITVTVCDACESSENVLPVQLSMDGVRENLELCQDHRDAVWAAIGPVASGSRLPKASQASAPKKKASGAGKSKPASKVSSGESSSIFALEDSATGADTAGKPVSQSAVGAQQPAVGAARARRMRSALRSAPPAQSSSAPSKAEIRAWAESEGLIAPGGRGRLPGSVEAKFYAAHGES